MINWDDSLIESIKNQRCIFYLGSGVSSNAETENGDKPKTWKKLLQKGKDVQGIDPALKEVINKYIDKDDFLIAGQLLRNAVTEREFNQLIQAEFNKPFNAADIHKHIFSCNPRIVITPNFDKIYETYVRQYDPTATVYDYHHSKDIVDGLKKPYPMIVKSHGTVDHPREVIFTQADYADARTTHKDFYDILNSLLMTHTFLFLGSGVNDPDIKMLLEDYNSRYAPCSKHYFTIPEDELEKEVREIYSKSLGVDFLTYNKANGHSELTESLRELSEKLEEE